MTTEYNEFDGDDGASDHRNIRTSFSNLKVIFRNKRKKLELMDGAFAVFGWGTTGTRICTEIALIEGETITGLYTNEAAEYESKVRADENERLKSRGASGLCNINSIPIGDNENIQPASRNFLISMSLLKNMKISDAGYVDSGKHLTRSRLIKRLETPTEVYIQFHILGIAGGTGNGILRYMLSDEDIKKIIKSRSFIPIAVLPGLNKITDSEYDLVNAISTYGYIKKVGIAKYFKQIIFIDNDLLSEHVYARFENAVGGHEHQQQNANMAHIMRTIFHSYKSSKYSSKAIGGSLKGFNQKYSTLGYGSSVYLNNGLKSAKKAFEKALQNNLLGYEFQDECDKCSVIVFITVPHRAYAKNIESVLRVNYGNKLNIVGFYLNHDFSYSIDVVLWICGAFENHINGAFKRLSKERGLEKYAKGDWYKECMIDLLEKNIVDVGEEEAEHLCSDALNDFDGVIKTSRGLHD